MKNRGFTLIEILVSIGILMIILAVGLISFVGAKEKKQLQSEANLLVLKLEESKTNALSGKYGDNFGIKFNQDSYVLFHGTYSSQDPDNQVQSLPEIIEIETDISNQDETLIFQRISGETGYTRNITVYLENDPEQNIVIQVGPLGEVSIVE